MKKIKMIIGLGNAVLQYYNTRHNVGFWFIDVLSDVYKVSLKYKKKFLGFVASVNINNNKIYLLKPDLFMNVSGHAVIALSSFYKIQLSEILVVRDELDLCPGVLKIKFGVFHNGHNGVKSIINSFKEKIPFTQLCIGIGRPKSKESISKFVLTAPNYAEKKMIQKAILTFVQSIQANI